MTRWIMLIQFLLEAFERSYGDRDLIELVYNK